MVGENKESLEELESLAVTAGIETQKLLFFKGDKINPAYYIGKGKLEELRNIINHTESVLVVFDNELSPAQHRNLEETLITKILDRSQLILDIFAIHAHTRESKLQVELAQLEYLLPRLSGRGTELSRLGGGIGTRGPGETKLETDRRRIQSRISRLKQELKEIKKSRILQRKNRHDPLIALVGYTNAGKSSLMNHLTEAQTLVADQLFATLDSTLRQFILPTGKQVIISDTVGFINNLPHQLVASFSTTLEEIEEADLLLHVVDASHPQLDKQIKVVNNVLTEIGVQQKETVLVFNKIDKITEEKLNYLELSYPEAIPISTANSMGIDIMLAKITEYLSRYLKKVILKIPYQQAGLVDEIYNQGEVIQEEYQFDNISLEANLPTKLINKINKTLDKQH